MGCGFLSLVLNGALARLTDIQRRSVLHVAAGKSTERMFAINLVFVVSFFGIRFASSGHSSMGACLATPGKSWHRCSSSSSVV